MFLGGAAIAMGVLVAWLTAPDSVPLWPMWPFVGVAVVGIVIPLTGCGPERDGGGGQRKLPRRFPTIGDIHRAADKGRDPSQSATEPGSPAPTNDG